MCKAGNVHKRRTNIIMVAVSCFVLVVLIVILKGISFFSLPMVALLLRWVRNSNVTNRNATYQFCSFGLDMPSLHSEFLARTKTPKAAAKPCPRVLICELDSWNIPRRFGKFIWRAQFFLGFFERIHSDHRSSIHFETRGSGGMPENGGSRGRE